MEEFIVGPYNSWGVEGKIILIKANPKNGFNFDYTIYIPKTINPETTLIVEGSNFGSTYDWSREKILNEMMKEVIEPGKTGKPIYEIATNLGMPVLYPIFPKWANKKGPIYNIMLSSNSLNHNTPMLKELGLERVDLQLIQMIKDAKLKLKDLEIDEKIIIDGFSASAKFANRFTLLHPEIVKACIAGGVAGMLTLPLEHIDTEKLLWPVGIGNLEELLGEKYVINIDEFKKVKQFYYMGMNDKNDPFEAKDVGGVLIPKYPELIEPEEIRQIYKYLGNNITGNRWENTKKIYNELGINATFKSYENVGHTPKPATEDITYFIKNTINLSKKKSIWK